MTARPAGPALEEGAGGADWRFVEAKWAKRSCSFFNSTRSLNFFCCSARCVRLSNKVSFGSHGIALSTSIPPARTPQLAHSYPVALESRVSTWSGRGCKMGGLPHCLLEGLVLKTGLRFRYPMLLHFFWCSTFNWADWFDRLGSFHSLKKSNRSILIKTKPPATTGAGPPPPTDDAGPPPAPAVPSSAGAGNTLDGCWSWSQPTGNW